MPREDSRSKAEGRKLRTQNSELPTQHPELRTADRFLQEQRHRFGTGAWHFPHTQDLIALSTGFGTTRKRVPDTIFRSKLFTVVGTMRASLLLLTFLFLNTIFLSTYSAASPPPRVTLERLEITQGIQHEDNSAPLIASRKTVVRAFFRLDNGTDLTLKGRLVIIDQNNNGTQTQEETVKLKASRNHDLAGRRLDKTASLNFVLPSSSIKKGIFSFQVGKNLASESGEDITCTNCDTHAETIQFLPPTTLRLRVVNFTYTKDGIQHKPSMIDDELIKSWLSRAYPVAHLDFSETEMTLEDQERFFMNKDCDIPTIQLDKLRFDEVHSREVHKLTRYIGLVADSGLVMRGCAFASSGVASAAIPIAVPTGPHVPIEIADHHSDKDGSYGDWYVGHELSHTFGLFHINACDTDGPYDPSPNLPNGLIKGMDGGCVGLDMGDSSLTSRSPLSMDILDGNKYHDVRSYCDPLWLSMYTYQRILCRLYEEDGVTVTPLCQTPGIGQLAPSIFLASLTGHFSTPANTFQERTHLVQSHDLKPLGKAKREVHIEKKSLQETDFVSEYPSEQLLAILANIEYDKKTGKRTGKILYSQKLARAMNEPAEAKKHVALRFLDENGKIIKEIPVAFQERPATKDGHSLGRVRDAVLLPLDPIDAVAIVWIETGTVLDVKKVGKTPPKLDDKNIFGKKIIIEKQDPIDISWTPAQVAAPTKSEDITYTVKISVDNGATWKTVAVGYKPAPTMLTPGGKIFYSFTITDSKIKELHLETVFKLKVKIIANDGFNSSEAIKDLDLSAGPG